METILAWVTHNVLSILGLGGYAVLGLLAIRGQWDRTANDRREESGKLSDGLITRLQQTVEQQANDISTMKREMKEHTEKRDEEVRRLSDELKHLQGRNGVLEDLFKGRDPAMQAFFKDAPKLIEIAHENNGLAKANSEATTQLTHTLEKFINTLQPILIHLEIQKGHAKR